MDVSDAELAAIHDAIAAGTQDMQDEVGPAILTGWVVVSEWSTADGKRYIQQRRSPFTTAWSATGMMHKFLHQQ